MSAVQLPAPTRLALWKERDPTARQLPGMSAGRTEIFADPLAAVAGLAAEGVRLARLSDPVDLGESDGARATAAFVVIRELTSHGIAVDWTLRPAASGAPDWRALSHLYPPAALLDAPDGDHVTDRWRGTFHATKCGYRHGPGFIEIRDRRTDSFRRLVIRGRQLDRTIESLLCGVPATALAQPTIDRYLRADLLHRTGDYLWWTPYRIRRWPLAAMIP